MSVSAYMDTKLRDSSDIAKEIAKIIVVLPLC
jgi:hypothetical protein